MYWGIEVYVHAFLLKDIQIILERNVKAQWLLISGNVSGLRLGIECWLFELHRVADGHQATCKTHTDTRLHVRQTRTPGYM
jgi:hypothetical protein